MMVIQCSMSKVADCVNKAVDLVFKDNDVLIALDLEKEASIMICA